MPHISVIIVNYNAGDYLKRCITSLLNQTYRDFEVLLIDNHSTDRSLENLPQDDRIHIILAEENLGFAAANNRAAQSAKGEWLALLNPDAFPEADWLEQLMKAAESHPQFSMFGSTQINAENPALLDGTGDFYHILGFNWRGNYQRPIAHLPETGESFAPCAAAALYKREIFLQAGGFDEHFFCYCEDTDLAFRLRLYGERCLQVKEAVVYHVGSGISGKTSDFARYYGIRNRFWVLMKNMPSLLLVPVLPLYLILQAASVKPSSAGVFIRAWGDTLKHLSYLLQARRKIQEKRRVSVFALSKMMTFSVKTLMERGSDIRPCRHPWRAK